MGESLQTKKKRKLFLILGNIVLVTVILTLCLSHVRRHQATGRESAETSFVTNAGSMGSAVVTILSDQQEACTDWATYINATNMTMKEALTYLKTSTAEEAVMAHIIDPGTYKGYSAEAKSDGSDDVDYSAFKDALSGNEDITRAEGDEATIHVTSTFTNPVSHRQSLGFLENITIKDKDYLLVRVVTTDFLEAKWVFPSQYEDATLSLINGEGDYIIRASDMKSENFWEFVRIANKIGYDDASRIKSDFENGTTEIMTLANTAGTQCYVTCQALPEGGDMYCVTMIPVSSIKIEGIDYSLVYIVASGMLMVLLFNSLYILDMNRQLRVSNTQALEASRAKTDFLSSMSHDIRTPMNAIIGLTTIASKNTGDKERVEDCLEKITLTSNHLLTLINDILDISKIEAGKFSLNPVTFSLSELVHEEINIIQPQIKAKSQNFKVHVRGVSHEYLEGDELRLNQIFINILSNAVKYTPEGGTITVDLSQSVPADDPSKCDLTYSVKDTGVGMSPEFVKIMYEPFTRVNDSRQNQSQGTGLGLAITRQMVDLMGGTIDCESEVGAGTTFTVHLQLPIADHALDDSPLPQLHVLAVDDDEIFLATAMDTFETLGLEADTAMSGEEAVQKVVDHHTAGTGYDVVFVDWKMPGQSGVDTVRAIRKQVGDEVPVIIVTAYDWGDIVDEARAAGANGFLSKPMFTSVLTKKLREIMNLDTTENPEESEDIARGLRHLNLLVAEDNDMNWEIIWDLLDMYDINSERAENGEVAVQMIQNAPAGTYDAILMDVQMPVMNGLEATRVIRAMDDADKNNIPIIALTADAFAEDIETCLEAGMNAHAAKPVNMKKLFAALRKVINTKEDTSS